jgi:hypothetical protein
MNTYYLWAAAADRHYALMADAARHRRANAARAASPKSRPGRLADSWTARWHLPRRRDAHLAGC